MKYSEIDERNTVLERGNIKLVERRMQDEGSYAAICYDITSGGEAAGVLTVIVSDESPAYIERIDIDEDKRGRGIGTTAIHIVADTYDGVALAPDSEDSARLYARIGREYDLPEIDQGYGVYIVD